MTAELERMSQTINLCSRQLVRETAELARNIDALKFRISELSEDYQTILTIMEGEHEI